MPQVPWQEVGGLTLRLDGAQALPLGSFQCRPSTLLPPAGLRPPPGLTLPPGVHLPAAPSGAPPAARADILCGTCEDCAEEPVCAASGGGQARSAGERVFLSAGSVGHPHACAGPCRYVKRKGGCRDGSKCSKCHLCFWSRTAEQDAVAGKDGAQQDAVVISVGTRGHPHRCGAACKYARRKGGCRNGAACTDCHVCLWQRTQSKDEEEQEEEGASAATRQLRAAPEIRQSYFGESTEKLTGLIAELLSHPEL